MPRSGTGRNGTILPMGAGARFWHDTAMPGVARPFRFNRRLVDMLYTDAMVLADEARAYFDDFGRIDRDELEPMARIAFSCESIKVTTRLMHVIAWLLTQRAVATGEITAQAARDPSRRLGPAPESRAEAVADLPWSARALVRASIALHRRVALLDADDPVEPASPARLLQDRLAVAF